MRQSERTGSMTTRSRSCTPPGACTRASARAPRSARRPRRRTASCPRAPIPGPAASSAAAERPCADRVGRALRPAAARRRASGSSSRTGCSARCRGGRRLRRGPLRRRPRLPAGGRRRRRRSGHRRGRPRRRPGRLDAAPDPAAAAARAADAELRPRSAGARPDGAGWPSATTRVVASSLARRHAYVAREVARARPRAAPVTTLASFSRTSFPTAFHAIRCASTNRQGVNFAFSRL